jgi:TPR repeat protein
VCVGKGRGVLKDDVEAARYYKLAADQNHVSTQKRYAVSLTNGQGVATNEAEAAGYFTFADDQNDASPQNPYAICLATERGVVKDEAEAARYSNGLPTRIMHQPKDVMRFALRPGEAL